MPHKKCPKCETPVGVRTLKCGCGYEFHTAKKQEELEVINEAVKNEEVVYQPPAPTTVKPNEPEYCPKALTPKEAEAELRKVAAELGYTIRNMVKEGLLREKFSITKQINNHKYIGIFTENGKITGVYEA